MMPDSPTQAKVATVLKILMERNELTLSQLAARCGVTYQTVKNVLDGGSPNARFISSLVAEFGLRSEPDLLRNLLLGALRAQFEDREGAALLQAAGLLKNASSAESVG